MRRKKIRYRESVLIGIALAGIGAAIYLFHPSHHHNMFRVSTPICDFCKEAAAPIDSSGTLDDLNDIQLEHAQIGGLKETFDTDEDFLKAVDKLVNDNVLIKLEDCRFFKIDELKHSQPYLIPEAVNLLRDIGVEFQKRLNKNGLKEYRFLVTSLLRTDESQHQLGRHNRNATTNSAHCYGTTFDISYNKFLDGDSISYSPKAFHLFTETLISMRQQCRFLIKKEHKQSCFHITVVVCKESLKNRQ
jgi:hypothetical protein